MRNRRRLAPLLLTAVLLTLINSSASQEASEPAAQPKVDVQVSVDKHAYKAGEPIEVTALIKNIGEAGFYVKPGIVFASHGEGIFLLHVTDAAGKDVRETYAVGGHSYVEPSTEFVRYVEKNWLYLGPDQFYGISHRFVSPELRPGRYTVTVEYSSPLYPWIVAGQSADKIRDSAKKMKCPALLGRFRSNSVAISVVK